MPKVLVVEDEPKVAGALKEGLEAEGYDVTLTHTGEEALFDFGTVLPAYSNKPVNVTTGSDNNNDGLPLDRPSGVGRNSLHGPDYLDLDLNLAHDFSLTKLKPGMVATASLNAFNVLNHPSYATYVGVVTSPFFGMPVSAQPPRRIQLNLEVKF